MSLPKRDPNFTMKQLHEEAKKFIDAGKSYFEAAHKAGIGGAVIWYEDANEGLVLFTRGEYRQQILQNIPMHEPAVHFGGAMGDEEPER